MAAFGGKKHGRYGIGVVWVAIGVAIAGIATPAAAQTLPEIRTHARNRVPGCVTPDRLMRFLGTGNSSVKPQFRDIAKLYKEHGEKLQIRWDYAFYQMILETNYLKFVNGKGQGDVKPSQNNFAGIGTTGGGVPGDGFPDVSTGVLAQMQHLVAYSGEHVEAPVARRTREKQDEIVQKSKALGRPPTFKDLTRRWAADGRYGSSIEFVAGRFRSAYCNGRQADPELVADAGEAQANPAETTKVAAAEPETETRVRGKRGRDSKRRAKNAAKTEVATKQQPVVSDEEIAGETPVAPEKPEEKPERPSGTELAGRAIAEGKAVGDDQRTGLTTSVTAPLPGSPSLAQRPKSCTVQTASYGGRKNVLIRAVKGGEMQLTALQVLDGQEESLAKSFIKAHAAGGEMVGEFPTRDAALLKAFDFCPAAASR